MRIKQIMLGVAVATLLNSPLHAATQADYDKARAEATAAIKTASDAKNEWRDTGKILKKADEAAKAGDFAKAIKLAETAGFQGKTAAQQAMEQANAGNPSYLY